MKKTYVKVEGEPDLVRDPKSKAILNVNLQAYQNHKKERDHRLKINKMMEEFDNVKSEISDIKNLLNMILTKL